MRYTEADWLEFQLEYAELTVALGTKLEPWEIPCPKSKVREAWSTAFNWLRGNEKCDA